MEQKKTSWKERWNQFAESAGFYSKDDLKMIGIHTKIAIRWMLISIIIGEAAGAFSSLFAFCLEHANAFRAEHPETIFALPIGGLVIVFLYRLCGVYKDRGTNLLFLAVQDQAQAADVPAYTAPLIFVATLITHLFGGSSGREGAALQMGGSIGNTIAKGLRQKEHNRKVFVMCGMSAAFSAVFGTPLAAAIFPLEMVNVGMMQYGALVPCVFASIVANQFALHSGILPESFRIVQVPPTTVLTLLRFVLLGLLCAWVSTLFCKVLRWTSTLYQHYFKNPYVKIVVGGCLMIAITMIIGDQTFSGAGVNLIEEALEGDAPSTAFLIKMLVTAITLTAGFKGGEIVPSFCIGATFGCLFGNIFSLSPSMCAAAGMIAVFCGVTNCPITSMLIGFELFGFSGVRYLLIVIAMSYLFSGYKSLYGEQTVIYSKYHPRFTKEFTEEVVEELKENEEKKSKN